MTSLTLAGLGKSCLRIPCAFMKVWVSCLFLLHYSYTMNKAALKALVVDGFPNYFPHAHTFSEDTMVAKVFRKMGVYPYETKDENGGERYMPFLPGHHWGYKIPADKEKDWYARYSINIKEGKDHCSPHSLAFHYVKGNMMKRLHALLYHMDQCLEISRNLDV